MKIRPVIFWLGAGVVGLLVLAVWLAKRPAETLVASPSETPVETSERKPKVAPTKTEITPHPRSPIATVTAVSNAATSVTVPDKTERAREVLATVNDVAIDFYGKVQDQFGSPVAGASITGSIIYDNGGSNGVREIQTVSDANGLFALHGGNGESLSVVPRKDGYALASTNAGFKYSHFYPEARHVPNPRQPVIIEMWKLQGAERLIHFQTKAYVQLDGTPSVFDLQTGQRVESGGDIVVRVKSSLAPNVAEKYDWRATIQVVNGGLVPCGGVEFEKMYVAPESGYESEFNMSYQKDAQPWSTTFNGGFYLKSRGGTSYGKLGVGINTTIVKGGAVLVMLNAYVNPAGSRNLELDPALVAEARP